jgi:hypothetical protein
MCFNLFYKPSLSVVQLMDLLYNARQMVPMGNNLLCSLMFFTISIWSICFILHKFINMKYIFDPSNVQ